MKKGFLFSLLLLPLSLSLEAQIIETTGSTTVMDGEYNVMNNVWGASTAQKLEVDLDGTYFKVILSEHNQSDVASYPAIFKGSHWGWATTKNNPMPRKLKEIGNAPFTWVIDTTGADGTWNAAFEAWIDDTPTGTQYASELMIWINYHGGAGPAGGKVATVEIGGHTWDVYFTLIGSPAWNYIAYKITNPVDSVSLDLKDFLYDALTRGYLTTAWYLINMEAGFEIWRDGQDLTTKSYSASVDSGSSLDVDYPLISFDLIFPQNKKYMDTLVIPFAWKAAFNPNPDPNSDPIEYIFHLSGPNIDTTIAQLDTTGLLFDGNNILEYFTIYTWDVKATNGTDTVLNNRSFEFRTPRATGIDDKTENIPEQFMLEQNFPNPFNPITQIYYFLTSTGLVHLSVYDQLGREVAVLVSEVQNWGKHEIEFSGSDLPSGTYFYRLLSNDGIITKKMMILK